MGVKRNFVVSYQQKKVFKLKKVWIYLMIVKKSHKINEIESASKKTINKNVIDKNYRSR